VSLHSDHGFRVEVEAFEAAAALDLVVEVHVLRHSLMDSHDAPCADARRLEQTMVDTQLVVVKKLDFTAGG
jgi:hypothetical protein